MQTTQFRKWMLVHDLLAKETVAAHMRRLQFTVHEGFALERYCSSAPAALRAGEDYLAHRRSCAGPEAYRNDVKLLNLLARFAGHRGVHWDMPARRRVDLPVYSSPEIERLLQAKDLQAAAVAQFNVATGLRRGEVAQVLVDDVDEDRQLYRVRCPTKNGPQRTLQFADPRLLERGQPFATWLRGRGRGPLWDSDVEHVGTRLWKAGRSVGVLASCQRGRRSFATWLYQAGATLPTIQHYLGHAQIETTRHYLKVGAEQARVEILQLRPQLPVTVPTERPSPVARMRLQRQPRARFGLETETLLA